MITPACKPVLGGRPGSVLVCPAGPSDESDTNEVLLCQTGKNARPRCSYQVIVCLFCSVFLDEQEVGTRGLFGLDPDLPQADGEEFLSFQMENEYKRSPIVVRSWRDSQVVSEKGNV